jgi:hypothetical protein
MQLEAETALRSLLIQGNESLAEEIDAKGHTPDWHAAHRGHIDVLKISVKGEFPITVPLTDLLLAA